MRIAAQLFQAANLGVLSAEISQEIADGAVVVTSGVRTERSGEGLERAHEQRRQRMLERRTARRFMT